MDHSHTFLTKNLVFPLWNNKSLDVIDRFFSKNVSVRTTFFSGVGIDILKRSVLETFKLFPDLVINVDEALQQDKKYFYRWSGKGCYQGLLQDLSNTARELTFSGMAYGEIEQGVVTSFHNFSNIPQMLQQLHSLKHIKAANQDLSDVSLNDLYHSLKPLARFPLTRREIECLIAWIRGCTIKETAKRMGGLSERTIQTYRENIKKKFGVHNYQQVLQLIQNSGLLPQLL